MATTRTSERWSTFIRDRRGDEPRTRFAVRIGMSGAYVSEWENHGKVPTIEAILRAAAALGDDATVWLRAAGLEEEVPLLPPAVPGAAREISGAYVPAPSTASLPVRGVLRAGEVTMAQEDQGEVFPCLPEHAALADYVVRVEGLSMWPAIRPGEYLAVKQGRSPGAGDIVVARRGDDLYVKRFVRRTREGVLLRSDNEEYPDVQGKDVEILGTVVWAHTPAEALRRRV